MQTCEYPEQISTQSNMKHHSESCRCDLESLHNLTSMLTLEGDHSKQEKFYLRMMSWHLANLTHALAHITTDAGM